MARMTSLRIILGLFHLTCVIRTGSSCGGNSALKKVVEMCKGGSTTDSHFYLHGAPAGGVQRYRCDCNLTITGAASSVYFTPVSVTNTAAICGGTLTLPDGSLRDCGWTSRADVFIYIGTNVVSFAYSAPDFRLCVEVRVTAAEANISIKCPLSTTTTSTLSSPSTTTTLQTTSVNVISSSISTTTASPETTSPLHIFTSASTSTPSSTKLLSTSTYTTTTAKSTTVSSSESRSTSPVTNTETSTKDGKPEGTTVEHTSFPVAAVAGGAGAGLLLLLVVVIVVILCYHRGRHVDKQEGDKQQENKGPTEVITVTNSLYESSADINNSQPTKPLTTDQQHVNNPTVEGQLPPRLTSGIAPGIAYQHNEKPSVAHQLGGTVGSTAPQDKTPAEPADGPSDVYAVVNKPNKSLEATDVKKQSDPENVSKEQLPPPIEDSAIYAKVNKPSLKTNL